MFINGNEVKAEFTEVFSEKKEGYLIKDGVYQSTYSGHVPSYLVVPDVPNGTAVIFMHPGQGDRSWFLKEAEILASKGIVSLLIDAPFTRIKQEKLDIQGILSIVTNSLMFKQTVADIITGVDVLLNYEDIKINNILYVGHSFGATWGGVLAGVEKRISGYILIAGLSGLSTWHRESNHPLSKLVRDHLASEQFQDFVSEIDSMNAINYIGSATPAELYFQFANQDDYVSKEQAHSYIENASEPKSIDWYDTDHLFTDCIEATQDRLKWIEQRVFEVS